jgi:hypothetical protein
MTDPVRLLLQTTTAPNYWAMAIGAAFLLYILLRTSRGKRKKDPLEKPFSERLLTQHRHSDRDMSNLLVELSEMARQITSQLDTRAAKLEVLIKEADEKIERLKVASRNSPADARPVSPDADAHALVTHTPEVDARHARVYALHDQGRTTAEIAHELARPRGEIELILALRPRQ